MRCSVEDVLDTWRPGASSWRGRAIVRCATVRVRFSFEYNSQGRMRARDFEYTGRGGGKLRRSVSGNDKEIYESRATKALDEWAQRTRRV